MNVLSILEVFGTVLAAGGVYEFVKWAVEKFVHRKQEQRLKESEADQSEVATEDNVRDMYEDTLSKMREFDEKRITEIREDANARIADLNKANAELHKQNLELLKASAKKDEIIEDKTAKIRELNELRVEDVRRIGELEKSLQYYDSWKCFREYGKGGEKCPRRKPQQNPPLKYKPLE